MFRALVVLLVLLAASVPPEVQLAGASEVTADELQSAQLGVVDARPPSAVAPAELAPPDPRRLVGHGSPTIALWADTQCVVLRRPPRALAVSRAVALRDQRPSIRRLRQRAASLDPASPIA